MSAVCLELNSADRTPAQRLRPDVTAKLGAIAHLVGLGHVVVRAGTELRVELRLSTSALAPEPGTSHARAAGYSGGEVIGIARVVLGVAGVPDGEIWRGRRSRRVAGRRRSRTGSRCDAK